MDLNPSIREQEDRDEQRLLAVFTFDAIRRLVGNSPDPTQPLGGGPELSLRYEEGYWVAELVPEVGLSARVRAMDLEAAILRLHRGVAEDADILLGSDEITELCLCCEGEGLVPDPSKKFQFVECPECEGSGGAP